MSGSLAEVEACIPALRRYASALLRSRQDADDLVHDCLLRALDRLHTRRADGNVAPWLFAIMHNLFLSRLRRAKVRGVITPLDQAGDAAVSLPARQEDGLRWRDLLRGLDRLPAEQRSVLLLVSVEDLSYAEVAQVLGIPIGTVMSRLSRGRERLRQLAEGQEGQAERGPKPALRRVK